MRPMRWINGSIINFVEKVLIQPWRRRGAAKVYVFSSHMMDILLSGKYSTGLYNFAAVGRWCDRVPGGMSNLGEVFIPVNFNSNHWNFIRVRIQTKMIGLWESMGLQTRNATYLTAAERFVKDATPQIKGGMWAGKLEQV